MLVEKEEDMSFDESEEDFSDLDEGFNYDDSMGDSVGFDEGGSTPLDKHNDLLKDLTNFDPYLKATFNNWLGLTWDEDKQKFTRNKFIKPVMSLNCATWCTGMQKTYTRGNNIITDISSEEYKNMVSDMIEAIWLNLGTRSDFKIHQDGDLLRVANELQHSGELALMGAGDGKYNKFLSTTVNRNESVNTNGAPQQQDPRLQKERSPSGMQKIRKALLGE
jgi:hypothetical protein